MLMTKDKFFREVGWMAEVSEFPCNDCVVRAYKKENENYEMLCKNSCAEAIEDVFMRCEE